MNERSITSILSQVVGASIMQNVDGVELETTHAALITARGLYMTAGIMRIFLLLVNSLFAHLFLARCSNLTAQQLSHAPPQLGMDFGFQ